MRLIAIVFLLFTSQLWAAEPCGKEGSIDERITQCNLAKGDFHLVARDENGLEIYKDVKTGLIWGDRISIDFNHYGSSKACSNDLKEAQILKDIKWRLPSVREFEVAASHGMKESLPHMVHTFWTATSVRVSRKYRRRRKYLAQSYLWNGPEERTETGDLKDAASVRCVAR